MTRRERIEKALSTSRVYGYCEDGIFIHPLVTSEPSRKNDNLAALVMHGCIVKICEGIEFDDSRKIAEGLVELKKYTNEFEAIFHENLANGCYRH